MLDMYTDFTLCQAKLGAHIEIVEMSDLDRNLKKVTDTEVKEKLDEIHAFFAVGGDSAADEIALRPSPEQIEWAAKVACGQERMVRELGLDAIAYYYHGYEDYFEEVQGGFIIGHSLLTAKGVPCAGEGDMKTAFVMRICDLLDKGGSFCEIVTTDYPKDAIIIGHDGPFHIGITADKPLMRGLALYHGKRGSGISVEASVRPGSITTFALAQAAGGKLRFLAFEGEAYADEMMTIGNTETHVDFGCKPDEFYQKWFQAAPAHHFALSVGHNVSLFRKVAQLLDIDFIDVKA
jgi:L-arabinose isomerase